MEASKKFAISLLFGWLIAGLLLLLASGCAGDECKSILLWHWAPIYDLAGSGPVIGHHADGTPIREGTPVHILFALLGLVAGFVIYPTVVYVGLTVAEKLKSGLKRRSSRA